MKKAKIESRVVAILDSSRQRRGAGSLHALGAIALGMGLLVPISVIRPVLKPKAVSINTAQAVSAPRVGPGSELDGIISDLVTLQSQQKATIKSQPKGLTIRKTPPAAVRKYAATVRQNEARLRQILATLKAHRDQLAADHQRLTEVLRLLQSDKSRMQRSMAARAAIVEAQKALKSAAISSTLTRVQPTRTEVLATVTSSSSDSASPLAVTVPEFKESSSVRSMNEWISKNGRTKEVTDADGTVKRVKDDEDAITVPEQKGAILEWTETSRSGEPQFEPVYRLRGESRIALTHPMNATGPAKAEKVYRLYKGTEPVWTYPALTVTGRIDAEKVYRLQKETQPIWEYTIATTQSRAMNVQKRDLKAQLEQARHELQMALNMMREQEKVKRASEATKLQLLRAQHALELAEKQLRAKGK